MASPGSRAKVTKAIHNAVTRNPKTGKVEQSLTPFFAMEVTRIKEKYIDDGANGTCPQFIERTLIVHLDRESHAP